MRIGSPLFLLFICFFLVSCDSNDPQPDVELPVPRQVDAANFTELDNGLRYYDFETGTGPAPEAGQALTVHYTGWLENGRFFDSSLSRQTPFTFLFDSGQVIQGWDIGLEGMQVGGDRQIIIPPELAYGERGSGNAIPPNSTLIFEVQLLNIAGQ